MNVDYDRHENALQIPRSAIVEELGSTSVFVVEDNVAIRRSVTTGFGGNGFIEITDGLDDDDYVITVGQVGLKPDAAVTVINPTEEQLSEDAPADETVAEGDT